MRTCWNCGAAYGLLQSTASNYADLYCSEECLQRDQSELDATPDGADTQAPSATPVVTSSMVTGLRISFKKDEL